VEVSANAALVQSTVSSLGETVMEHEILDLPLDGRNFSQLGLLQPGVVPLTPGLLEAGGPARQNQAYAVDGQRPESNNFMIDGADNVSSVDGGFVLKPPIDAIAEFKILSHNANAEFGRNTGSTTNIVTRSGSNSFHGAAWEFLRNDAMDSSDYFTQSVQPLKQNQFGATSAGRSSRTRPSSSDITKASETGRVRPCRQPCLLGGKTGQLRGALYRPVGAHFRCLHEHRPERAIRMGNSLFLERPVPFNQMTIFHAHRSDGDECLAAFSSAKRWEKMDSSPRRL
jgi:hypothetical protein